jgi:hypothetical protein
MGGIERIEYLPRESSALSSGGGPLSGEPSISSMTR